MEFNRRIFMLSSVTHTFKQTLSSPGLSGLSTTESGLRQIQAGKMFPPGSQSADRDCGCKGRACMLFASIKRRSGVTRGQANREAFVQSTSYEQKLLRVDPAGRCICILLSSEETAPRVALVSEPNRVDGFGSVVLLLNLLSPPEPLSGRGFESCSVFPRLFCPVLLCFPASFSNHSFPSANKASDSCCCNAA